MNRPRAMAFDLDGTLAESKQRVSAEMGELLGSLLAHIPVAVLSGGSWKQFEVQLLPSFPVEANLARLFLFPTSAAECFVFREHTWRLQYDNSFSDTERAQILAAITQAKEEVHFIEPERLWGEQIEDRGAEITFSALGQEAPLEEKERYDPTKEKRRPLYDVLVRLLPDFSLGLNAMTSIDITRKGITKAYGIRRFSELTQVAIPDILYVGDALGEGGNDAVVLETGIETHAVFGPTETATLIETLLHGRAPALGK